MSYLVLARKWRPQKLGEILGQEHVTRTLGNAFASGRIAQTYLFSGPRGVGKTSAARILARALCCEASDRPTPEPCGTCAQCVAIANGSSTDVIEMDAASNTQVDKVREVIIEAVRYLPASARYKVYIIDEVHMLSGSSFNALLKTFEEPPEHVKFVLATTDPHKIPATVLSRCQRYDFRLIPSARIQSRLSEILSAEGVEHDPGALALVARYADGSMRDAQSLLEQVLAFAGERPLDGALVRSALGVVDAALVEGTFEAIFARNPAEVLSRVGEAHERGLGHVRFAASLVEHARDLVVAKVMPSPGEVLDRPADEVEALCRQAAAQEHTALERLFEQLCRVQEDAARAASPRYVLEVGLVSLAAAPARLPLEDLSAQLDRLERALGPGGGPPGRGGPSGPGGGGRPQRGRMPAHESFDRSPPRTQARAKSSRPVATPDAEGGGDPDPDPASSAVRASAPARRALQNPSNDESVLRAIPGGADSEPSPKSGSVPAEPSPRSAPRVEATPAGRRDEPPWAKYVRSSTAADSAPERVSAPTARVDPPPPEPEMPPWLDEAPPWGDEAGPSRAAGGPPMPPVDPRRAPALSFGDAFESHRAWVQSVARVRPALAASLHQVRPLAFEVTGVRLACETAFDDDKLSEPDTRRALEETLAEHFGQSVRLEVVRKEQPRVPEPEGPRTLNEQADHERRERIRAKEAQGRSAEAVRLIERELGASIAAVRVLGEDEEGNSR